MSHIHFYSLSADEILDFMLLYEEEYGKPLSFDEAAEMTRRLLNLYDLLLQTPRPENP